MSQTTLILLFIDKSFQKRLGFRKPLLPPCIAKTRTASNLDLLEPRVSKEGLDLAISQHQVCVQRVECVRFRLLCRKLWW